MEGSSTKPYEDNQSDKGMPNISLRLFQLSDLEDVMVWMMDDRVSQFCGWDTFTSKENVLDYMKDVLIFHPWCRAICLDNKAIGEFFVEPNFGIRRCRGEICYTLAYKHWGKGFATLNVKIVVDSIFKDMSRLERLEGLVDVENLRSQRVLKKAGFTKEGVLRKYYISNGRTMDMVMYSFLPTFEKTVV